MKKRERSAHGIDPVRHAYDRLASIYDRKWSGYVQSTVRRTLHGIRAPVGSSILDLGCGTGQLLKELSESDTSLRLHGTDLSFEMLTVATNKFEVRPVSPGLVQSSALALPYRAACFDWIISTSVFHFFPDPRKALQEIRRVLVLGGHLVLADWCDDFLSCKLCSLWLGLVDPAHRPPLGEAQCHGYLEEAGFVIESSSTFRAGWIWGMMLFECRKAATEDDPGLTSPGSPPDAISIAL